MYKIAILGCENSHANAFLDFLIKEKKLSCLIKSFSLMPETIIPLLTVLLTNGHSGR